METDKTKKDLGKKQPAFSSFLVIIIISGIIGFVTIIPGKNNHIKEFPDLITILKRELWFIGIPVVIGFLLPFINKYLKKKMTNL